MADRSNSHQQIGQISSDLGDVANARGYMHEQTYTAHASSDSGFTFDAKAIAEVGRLRHGQPARLRNVG